MGRILVYGEGVVVGTSRCRCCAGFAPHRLCVSCLGCCEPRIVLHVNNNKHIAITCLGIAMFLPCYCHCSVMVIT